MNFHPETISIYEYSYDLPANRIAEFPLEKRDNSKLLIYNKGEIIDSLFKNLPEHLPANESLVLNDTRVLEARLLFQKKSGGVIEIFCLKPHQQSVEQAMQQTGFCTWECFIGGASKWKQGQILEKRITNHNQQINLSAKYMGKNGESFLIEFSWQPLEIGFSQILHTAGVIPLPPYIKRAAIKLDEERYQTVFARYKGSVAAPTAALHFSETIFEKLKETKSSIDYVTLHVGAGTFKPVKTNTIAEHQMHSEPFSVKKKTLQSLIKAQTIIAVGTTSLRTLESLHWLGIKIFKKETEKFILNQWEAYDLMETYSHIDYKESFQYLIQWMKENSIDEIQCRTSLLIVPGYEFKIPSGLITNFHQPQSTLLLLVAAFIGEDWKKVYQHALNNEYRFLSYGDSSLLWKKS